MLFFMLPILMGLDWIVCSILIKFEFNHYPMQLCLYDWVLQYTHFFPVTLALNHAVNLPEG